MGEELNWSYETRWVRKKKKGEIGMRSCQLNNLIFINIWKQE